jgi:hypothetical protein
MEPAEVNANRFARLAGGRMSLGELTRVVSDGDLPREA